MKISLLRLIIALAASFWVTGPQELLAQSYVSPAYFTSAEADSENRWPFGNKTTFRYLQVHDDVSTAVSIGSIAFRRTGVAGPGTSSIYPAFSLTLDLYISTASTTSKTPTYSFAQNH